MVLPAGFALPPPPYLLMLALGVIGVGGLLLDRRPSVSEWVVVAFAPWMLAGAGLHAVHQLEIVDPVLTPLFGTPAVYVTVAILAGAAWGLAEDSMETTAVPVAVGLIGTLCTLVVLGWIFLAAETLALAWPTVGLLGSILLAAGVWIGLRRAVPDVTVATGAAGALVVLAHVLDGVTTAIGYDVLGYGERTPASRLILELGAALPTAELIGAGWLFVLVKLLLAVLVVWLFSEFVREDPTRGYLLLAVIAAVGLGPGGQNLLLYAAG